jgi:hypothetical protein
MSQLTNYIQKELDKGFAKDLITKKLLQAGYVQEEITESFKSLKTGEPLLKRKFVDTIHEDAKVIRSKWLFPILGVLLLIVFGYLIFHYVEIPSGTECDNISDIEEKDICYLTLAAEGEDVCEKIVSSSIQLACTEKLWETQQCVYEKIIGEVSDTCKEPTDCKKTEDYTQCITELAIEQKDVGVCEKKMRCVTVLAIEMNDGSLCNELRREKQYCTLKYFEATGDSQYCTLGDLECGYHSEATDTEKSAFFEQNIAAIDKEGFNDYILEFAVDYNEPLVCQYLHEKDEIMQNVLDTNNIIMPDLCIMAVAHNTKDAAICDMLTETHKYSLCIETLNCTEGELCDEMA